MNQHLYWHAPVWEVAAVALAGLVILALLVVRALRRPDVRSALLAFDPGLDRLPLFHFDGAHGLRALNRAAAELLDDAQSVPEAEAANTIVEASLATYEEGRASRREGCPTADDTLMLIPISSTGDAVTGVLALVSSSTLKPPTPGTEGAWADADPAVWLTLGKTLMVHRVRPIVRARTLTHDPEQQAHLQWEESQLTHTEDLLLRTLIDHEGEVRLAEDLFAAVWPDEEVDRLGLRPDQGDRLRRLVFQLRQRVEPDPGNPRYVTTARGAGYALYAETAGATR